MTNWWKLSAWVVSLSLAIATAGVRDLLGEEPAAEKPAERPNVFAQHRQSRGSTEATAKVQRLFRQRNYAEAEKLLLEATTNEPAAVDLYNLACAQARLGKTEAALASLEKAVELGFQQAALLAAADDLASLHDQPRFQALLERLRTAAAAAPSPAPPEPRAVESGVALVGLDNTIWNPQSEAFESAFRIADDDPRRAAEAVAGHGVAGELIRQWQQEGTACGLLGVLYDNHDRDHSNLPVAQFPQLSAVEYCDEAKAQTLDHGMAASLFFNLPTFGNSSTALTGGPFWRSQTRLAQVNPRTIAIQHQQYASNHIYFYPEHRDHDAGRNGSGRDVPGEGFGDVYPANTPYVITSQGSSGSDQAFLHAVACTLAAFQPATRDKLTRAKLLAPTVQMTLRRSNQQVASDAEYLTGKAHPVVFQGDQLDVERMVRLAHEIEPTNVPPRIQLAVVKEDEFRPGIDYFDAATSEKLFDTPAAIARVWRSTARERRMVVSAATSSDENDRPLAFHWAVLQGRAGEIEIRPIKADASLVEIRVRWHERFPIAPDSKMESNRIDIGAFAHNGAYYSAPAFVTFCCLDDEARTYDERGQIQAIEYRSPAGGGNYADPAIHTPRDWRDEYHYDDAGRLTGWTRKRGDASEEFTAGGHLIVEKDAAGRAKTVKKVAYVLTPAEPNRPPNLQQVSSDETFGYEYESPADRVGKLAEP